MKLSLPRDYSRGITHSVAEHILRFRACLSHSPLLTILKDTIRKNGPITIERYMEITLQHPLYGYYRQGDPIGTDGDFHTAPEISPMFGEMVGVWCLNAWEKMGKPEQVTLLELGPGRGTLLCDLLRFTEAESGFHNALKIGLFESSSTLRAIQQERLTPFSPVHIESLNQLAPRPILIIANEFFDNIPTRQFINTHSGWSERLVDVKDHNLIFVDREITDPSILKLINDNLKDAKPGDAYETSSQSHQIIEKISEHIVHYGGEALIIDYGFDLPYRQTTLAAWSRHMYTDILESPGKTDVTAGVDFSALRRAAKRQQAQVAAVIGQGNFLLGQGIEARANTLSSQSSPEAKKKINVALHKLTSPAEMGDLWKVMVISGPKK